MTENTPAPTQVNTDPTATPDMPSLVPAKPVVGLSRAAKAWGAGVAGAATALGAVSVAGLFTAHGLDATAISTAGGSIVAGFLLGFVGAFFPTNKTA